MSVIYSLLIGINDYPYPVRKLKGCVNDVNALNIYLTSFAHQRYCTYIPLVLLNENATRKNIIEGFQHFENANDGDICVLAYSGHGATYPAHQAFWHQEPNKKHESLVCYDSRTPGQRDLFDKELSWLIWKATKGEKIHLLVLMDCCYAGTNVRFLYSAERRYSGSETLNPIPLQNYLGVEDYDKHGRKLSPPRGNYLQFAAARSTETAKESYFEEGTHGVFTYALLKELQSSGRSLTYEELYQRLSARVKSLMTDQNPQWDYTNDDFPNQLFLSNERLVTDNTHLIFYDKTRQSWLIDIGGVNGMNKVDVPKVELLNMENSLILTIDRVFASFSTLADHSMLDWTKIYQAKVKLSSTTRTKVAYVPALAAKLKTNLPSIQPTNLNYVEIQEEAADAQYWIDEDQLGRIYLRIKDNQRPLFRRTNVDQQPQFWKEVDQVGRWHYFRFLSNPNTSLPTDCLKIELYQFETDYPYADTSLKTAVQWPEAIDLRFKWIEGRWRYPAFQCKITNTSNQLLWVGALFLSNNYSIMNGLLPKKELAPGTSTWLSFLYDSQESTIIRNGIEKSLQEVGVTVNRESIKILASKEEIYTDSFIQGGLEPERFVPTRTPPLKDHSTIIQGHDSNWTTFDIDVITRCPLNWKMVKEGKPLLLFGHKLRAPARFSAQVSLQTAEELDFDLLEVSLDIDGNHAFGITQYFWTDGFNQAPGLSILALREISGSQFISKLNPFEIVLPEDIIAKELCPFYYDRSLQSLKLIDCTTSDRAVQLYHIPDPCYLLSETEILLIFLYHTFKSIDV